MTRKKKLIVNTITSFLRQLTVIICGFILPKQILLSFGNDVNGLVASIAHFLSFISFLELGIGPVIQSNLYKPLAEKDSNKISKVVKSSNRFFRRLAIIFLVYIIVLFFLYPLFINRNFDFWFTASLVVIISFSTFAEYFFGTTYTLLLNADQKVYVQSLINIVTVLLNTVSCVILIKQGFSIHVVKLVSAAIFVFKPIFLNVYAHYKYNIDDKVILLEEPIKQKWNGFAQHLASTISNNIDVVLLTLFSSLISVSVYSVYHTVTYGIANVILMTVAGLESYWGNMIAKNEIDTLKKSFETIEFIMHAVNTCIFLVTAIMIVPFVNVYVSGVKNAEVYNLPLFGITLVMSYFMLCLRIPYFRMIKASGHYKQTQTGSFISMGLNILLSIILVFKFDLMGVAIGTLIAFSFHTVYLAAYLRKNILCRPFRFFLKHVLVDFLIMIICVFIVRYIDLNVNSYIEWFVKALLIFLIVFLITFACNFLFYISQIKMLIKSIKR